MKKYKIVIIFIVCIALVLCAIFWASHDKDTPKLATEISEISKNIRRFYGKRPGFWGLNTETALKNNLVPAHMVINNKIINAYKKLVDIGKGSEASAIMPGARGFDIILRNLSKKECMNVATYKYDDSFLLGISAMTIKNGDQEHNFGWEQEKILPISKIVAKNVCDEDKNTIIWSFE